MSEAILEEQEKKKELELESQRIYDEEFENVYAEDTALDHVVAPVLEEKKEVVAKEEKIEVKVEEKQTPSEEELSPALQAKFDGLQKEKDATEVRLKQFENRMGGITNKYHQAIELAETLKKAQIDAPTEEAIIKALKSKEEWKELMDDYPSMSAVDERFTATENRMKDKIASLDAKIDGYSKKVQSEKKIKTDKKTKEDIKQLHADYPNYYKDAKSEEFGSWLAKQPLHKRLKANSTNLESVSEAMHDFLEDTKGAAAAEPGKTRQDKKEERLNLSAEKETGRSVVHTSKTDDELSEQEIRDREFDKVFAE